jgi:hypothetical protein
VTTRPIDITTRGIGHGLAHPDRVDGVVAVSSAGLAERVVEGPLPFPFPVLTRLLIRMDSLTLAHAGGVRTVPNLPRR